MSRKAYTAEERDAIRMNMLRRSAEVFAEKGLRETSLEDIYLPEGISKTFFYSFFPSKAALIIEMFHLQSEDMLGCFRTNVWNYGADNGLRTTLDDLLSGRWLIATFDDQTYNRTLLSDEEFAGFKNDRIVLFAEVLNLLGVPVSRLDPRVFYNMLMSIVWIGRTGKHSLPFLYGEAVDEAIDIQVDRLVELVSGLRVDAVQRRFRRGADNGWGCDKEDRTGFLPGQGGAGRFGCCRDDIRIRHG